MRRKDRWIGVMLVLMLLLAVTAAFAQDWPQWRGPNRDGKVAGFTAPDAWPQALTQKWRSPVGNGDASPVLVGDKVFAFGRLVDQEVTTCLNAADGATVWQDKYAAAPTTGPAARHPGPRATPCVADGKVVTIGVAGVMSCLDAATGKLVWRKDPFPGVTPRFFTSSSPIVVDGLAIGHLGGPGNGAMIAFDLNTGDEKWRWGAEGPDYASPVLLTVEGTKQLVTLTEKGVAAVGAADGKLLWSIPFAPAGMNYNSATPIVDGNTVIYTGAGRGTFAVTVAKQGDAFAATPAWSNTDIASQFSTPVLNGGSIYGVSARGFFYCLDAKTGQTAWLDSVQRDRSGFCPVLDAGAVLLALPSSGDLLVIKPDTKAYTEVAKIKVADTPTYATPVVAGKAIFVKDQDNVTMWTLG